MKNVTPSCSACFNLLIGLAFCGALLAGCGSSQQLSDGTDLVALYRKEIGCSNYGRLHPMPGEHRAAVDSCGAQLAKIIPGVAVITGYVYDSLNKGILFVHVVYRNGPNKIRKGYNFLVRNEGLNVLGGYPCGPG